MRQSGQIERARLEAPYLQTVYCVRLDDGSILDLRIGRRHPRLDRRLARVHARHWVFLTAWNPESTPLPAWRNAARQRVLRRCLKALPVLLPGIGIAEDGAWWEESLLAASVSVGRARRFGRMFGQHAVVVGRVGGFARLCWC
ncbi:MAG TPA: DUF3293 domain-containing protein [Burkholderiales bacterium]|nr:DUF3293 domain-containing protein [Burkholderiales bacterium]